MKTLSVVPWRVVPLLALLAPAVAVAQLPTAPQVAAQIGVGINIGNTLEAPCGETCWGNPPITQAYLNALKAAGFNSVRIPCAWDSHADQTTMTIDPAWLARVKEVVDYAVNNNMYVILNAHWDGGWLEEHPLYSYQAAVNVKQRAYWTQIANYFKGYDQHLLFAGTNEVHANYEAPTAENIAVQQSYNQTFVDAVRATGGNNATRPLVVQTYNTNIQHGLQHFTLPTDSASNRLLVEVHYYDPYDYTLNSSGSCLYWGAPYPTQPACTWAYESYVDSTFASVNQRWVAQGVPVIIGEWAVIRRTGLDLASRAYYLKYVSAAAARNGIKTYYWDAGPTGSGLFERTGAIVDQAGLDAVLQGAGVGNPNVNYTLTTSVTGTGTVTRSPAGTSYPGGTNVTLTATPAAGQQFAGWSGDAAGTTNPLVYKIIASSTVTANFVPEGSIGTGKILREYWLNVGGSTVADLKASPAFPSSPSGSDLLSSINGPLNWGDSYGTRIRGYIHPPATGAYTFWIASDDGGELWVGTSDDPATATRIAYVDGWTNSLEWSKFASQRSAAVNLTGGQKYYIEVLHKEQGGGDNVAVAWQGPGIGQSVIGGLYISPFVPTTGTNHALSVVKAGTGTGTVTSSTGGINCGATCSANIAANTVVTLTASFASPSTFGGWSGACSGTATTCSVTMSQARTVTATFNTTVQVFALTVTKTGASATSGTVTSSVGGINCGATCSANIPANTVVTLTASIASPAAFGGWSGACSGTATTCSVTMSQARAVTATFPGTTTYPLTVAKAGTGAGTVTSSTGGINCGSTCSASLAGGTLVTLTSTPASGSTFGGWSGGCTGTATTCTVTMNAAQTVTATFGTPSGTTPCASPVTFTSNTNNFNTTGAVCYRTSQTVNGWGCSNFGGRTVSVNGGTATATCGAGPFPLRKHTDGYTYFAATAGTYPWANLYVW